MCRRMASPLTWGMWLRVSNHVQAHGLNLDLGHEVQG